MDVFWSISQLHQISVWDIAAYLPLVSKLLAVSCKSAKF